MMQNLFGDQSEEEEEEEVESEHESNRQADYASVWSPLSLSLSHFLPYHTHTHICMHTNSICCFTCKF